MRDCFYSLSWQNYDDTSNGKSVQMVRGPAGLSPHYSIHLLQHTYPCHQYKASGWNLRLVQKQLGHSSVSTTQGYADVMGLDMLRALERMYR